MQNNPFSYRHFTMYMHAMELVRLGDTSVEAYNRLMAQFKSNLIVMLQFEKIIDTTETYQQAYERLVALFQHCAKEMKPFAEIRDGLGLEDRIADKGVVLNDRTPAALVADQNQQVDRVAADIGENDSMSRTSNRLDGLLAPAKREEIGRPTTSREKAPYEGLNKRTRFCTICRRQGHKRTTCLTVVIFRSNQGNLQGARTVVSKATGGTTAIKRWN